MKATQIHLSDEDFAVLDAESARTGASRGELIRRAIRVVYGRSNPSTLPRSIGIVSDGRWTADTIDDELAQIYEERYKRWHG
jgi:hypothetical protein